MYWETSFAGDGFEGGGEFPLVAGGEHHLDLGFGFFGFGEGGLEGEEAGVVGFRVAGFESACSFGRVESGAPFFDQGRAGGGFEIVVVELGGGGDDEAAGGDHEGDEEAGREVEDGEAAVFFAPAPFEHRVGEEEGHVDADGGGEGGHDDVALFVHDGRAPFFGIRGQFDERGEGVGRAEEGSEVGDEAFEDRGPRERGVFADGEHDDDADEGKDDEADHDLEEGLEELDALTARTVGPDDDDGARRG